MHVVGLPLHQGERLILYLCLLALLTAVSVPRLSSLASLSVRRHEAVLPLSFQQLKKKHSSRLESKQQELIPAVSALKSNLKQNRSADRAHPLQPTAKAQPEDLKQHRDLRERRRQHLSLRVSFADAGTYKPASCIIPDVCVQFSFSKKRVYVPAYLRPHARLLRRCVGYLPLEFYEANAAPLALHDALRRRQDVDVIGVPLNSIDYRHFAHFIMEWIRRVSVPASLFLRPREPGHRWLCPLRAGKLHPCAAGDLRPRVVVSKEVINRPRKWNNQFFRMLLGRSSDRPSARPERLHVVPVNQPLQCFKSMLTSPQSFDTSSAALDALARSAGVKRARVSTCSPRVVVIVRDPAIHLARTMPASDIQRLRKELHRQLPAGASIDFHQGLAGMRLREQVALFQRTDVLVTVHGAELSNLLWLRRGASVLEIFPFGYNSGWFDGLVSAVGARHPQVVSAPETERFLKCLDTTATKKLSGEEVSRVKEKYLRHVRMFEGATTDEERQKAGSFSDVSHVMQSCARKQRIFVDPVKIAAIAVEEARKKCPGN